MISVLVPFSDRSIVSWLSQTHDAAGVIAYFVMFYFTTIELFVVPLLILILFFGLTLFGASRILRLNLSLKEAENTTLVAYAPFLLFFWVPLAFWALLIAAAVLLVRRLSRKFTVKKSILMFAVSLILFLAVLSAFFFSIYLSADYKLAEPVRGGDLYLVGHTDDGGCGVHGMSHNYTISYNATLADKVEIYQPVSFYDTLPVSEVVLFSYLNLKTLNGYLLQNDYLASGQLLKKSFPPRLSDSGNPPVKLYYIGYTSGSEMCALYFPVWREQLFGYHSGDITPIMICWKDGKPSKILMSARTENASKIDLFRKGLSNLKQGLPIETAATPFLHGSRVLYSGKNMMVMNYTNPLEYVNSDVELPAELLVVTPWHTFRPYSGEIAVKTKPEPVPLTEEAFYGLAAEYPDLDISYDLTDPFGEPYTYINYPSVKPVWPKKVNETFVAQNGCIFLSPLWVG